MAIAVIDSHCHLADPAFGEDLEAVVSRAGTAGVERALCILSADEPDELARATAVRAAWPAIAFAAGVHPHRAGTYADQPERAARVSATAIAAVEAVAVGEIGLDYHYDHAPRPVQQAVFAAQAALAVERGLPVVIHTREAADDTFAILAGTAGVRGVMHCFSGTPDEARRALDLGFYISLSGILTFPRAANLRELAVLVPEDRLLVETDAPYLAPVPHRGKRNEPAWVAETFAALAAVRGTEPERLAGQIRRNFDALVGAGRATAPR